LLLAWVCLLLACFQAQQSASGSVLAVERAEQLDVLPADTVVVRLDIPLVKISSARQEKLRTWLADGGTAWFHTDAARAFGFDTTPLRSSMEAVGKAVRAAPLAANPLLEGVEKIRYALAPGDCLLHAAKDVLELLRVEDAPAGRNEPVFVAGWKRFGFGEAFFLPSNVNDALLDGARFLANWHQRCTVQPNVLFVPVNALLALSGTGIVESQVQPFDTEECIATVKAWASAFERGEQASNAGGTADRGYIPLDERDLSHLRNVLGLARPESVARGAADVQEAQALAAAWLGREEYRLGRVDRALEWFDVALKRNPHSDVAGAWKGCALWTQGEQIARPAPERAALLEQAAAAFTAAQSVGGDEFSRTTLRQWARDARTAARLYALEPPLVKVLPPFVVRYAPGDPSVADAMAALKTAERIITTDFGIQIDETEVLLFPSLQQYASYMAAAGYEKVTEWEAASSDDRRIFSYLKPGREYVGTMAHEFGHVAVSAITEGGAPVPQWIHEGIACAVTPGQPDPRPFTQQAFAEGALMSIADLNAPEALYDHAGAALLYFQSQQMVQFMVRTFGKYALLNVLEEIGRGTAVDKALQDVIGMNQQQFLDFWVASEFGP